MDQKHIVFKHIDPPKELLGGILLKIDNQKKKSARIKLFFSSLGVASSLGVFALAFNYAMEVFYQSGAYTYMSILLSDPSFAVSYSSEMALSIAESLPILELAILLFATFAFLESIKYVIENISNLSLKKRLAV
ncbi:MAG: hypothetical protein UT05_C0003G0008 [Parcubacteria group bacterium GW2011_GWF2_38_76]|nr:MAG: hypothetical protein UT05_C0003G0008 [Parcubacteria group bacterium GW2011_GWF2_38_76]HBM46218.1 hypothetical protein [Patescibacteria group bacterium]